MRSKISGLVILGCVLALAACSGSNSWWNSDDWYAAKPANAAVHNEVQQNTADTASEQWMSGDGNWGNNDAPAWYKRAVQHFPNQGEGDTAAPQKSKRMKDSASARAPEPRFDGAYPNLASVPLQPPADLPSADSVDQKRMELEYDRKQAQQVMQSEWGRLSSARDEAKGTSGLDIPSINPPAREPVNLWPDSQPLVPPTDTAFSAPVAPVISAELPWLDQPKQNPQPALGWAAPTAAPSFDNGLPPLTPPVDGNAAMPDMSQKPMLSWTAPGLPADAPKPPVLMPELAPASPPPAIPMPIQQQAWQAPVMPAPQPMMADPMGLPPLVPPSNNMMGYGYPRPPLPTANMPPQQAPRYNPAAVRDPISPTMEKFRQHMQQSAPYTSGTNFAPYGNTQDNNYYYYNQSWQTYGSPNAQKVLSAKALVVTPVPVTADAPVIDSVMSSNYAASANPYARSVSTGVESSKPVASIYFRDESAALGAKERQVLAKLADWQQSQGGVLKIVGHASQRTRDMRTIRQKMVNYKLSLDRAEAVARHLRHLGVAENSIVVDARGDNDKVYAETMPNGEAWNRRTEIFWQAN